MEPQVLTTMAGLGGGCALTYAIASWAIKKALADLSELVDKIHEIDKAMAAMFVHLNSIAEHDIVLKEHAAKIAFLEGQHDAYRQAH